MEVVGSGWKVVNSRSWIARVGLNIENLAVICGA